VSGWTLQGLGRSANGAEASTSEARSQDTTDGIHPEAVLANTTNIKVDYLIDRE